ncbi:MAG TPA: ShlB/FhaC/HecB family hemolysin secretion/activation protein [Rhodocyclaceae bacterium]|nr:ShlB/FhaC/HecB family hemolysin secretion/activation protein [Rhodocyclaceae bacterium]
MKRLTGCTLAFMLLFLSNLSHAADDRFDIRSFQVTGNTLLPSADVDALVAPFTGKQRNYGDIQKALEALENAYRAQGYGTVQVHVPEQELTNGDVRLDVTESVLGTVTVTGNKHHDTENIRRSLPQLAEGKAPNLRRLSEGIQLANENPSKQVAVTLGVVRDQNKVDAKAEVTDENPVKYLFSLDNTGTSSTGRLRAGVALQHANVANADQVMTFAYTDSPDKPAGVNVQVYSFAYRVPFYGIGESLDFIYGKSTINTPTAQATGFAVTGKGDVAGLRWNHYFQRRGEYTAKLIAGFDYKYMNTRCKNPVTGALFDIAPPTPDNPACTPYTVRPFSLTYTGQRQSPGQVIDYSLGAYQNWATGTRYAYTTASGTTGFDRYSVMNPDGGGAQRKTPDNFNYLKLSFNYLGSLASNWTARAAFNGQYSATPLPSSEQFGLAGSMAVRGFNERAVAMDKGYFVNLEIYSPEISQELGIPGNLKALLFYDFALGNNNRIERNAGMGSGPYEHARIASAGAGLRYSMRKDVSLRFDLANVLAAAPGNPVPGATASVNKESRGDWRGHAALLLAF